MSKRRSNGFAIRAIREAQGIPGSVFATRCLISHAYLSNIEKERKFPPVKVLTRIANELAVDINAVTYIRCECAEEDAA